MKKGAILMIYTGGTIGMKTDPYTGVLSPFDFGAIYEEFPNLHQLGVDIEVRTLQAIDSSNVTPELWVTLAKIIEDNYERFDGFVVLHGTDTMSYSASALSFMLKNLSKPVVFTGSQIPIGVMRSDGRENVITAVEIASARRADGSAIVPEVCLYFQNRLFRANRTTKYSAEELHAFRSDNYSALAEVGVSIHYNEAYILRPSGLPFAIDTTIDSNVLTLRLFPGINEAMVRGMLELDRVRGVVLQTYGTGNAPTFDWFIESIVETVERGIPVINITQCRSGGVDMDLYETGIRLLEAGVISGKDMTTEAAITKLMCLLGRKLSQEKLTQALRNSIRGELS